MATIDAWDIASGQLLFTLCGHTDSVNAIKVIKPDFIASGSADTTIRLWNLNSDECMNILKGHKATITSLEYLSSGYLV